MSTIYRLCVPYSMFKLAQGPLVGPTELLNDLELYNSWCDNVRNRVGTVIGRRR